MISNKHFEIELFEAVFHIPNNEAWNPELKIPRLTLVLDKVDKIAPTVRIQEKEGSDAQFIEVNLYMMEYDAHVTLFIVIPVLFVVSIMLLAHTIVLFIENNRVWYSLDWQGVMLYYYSMYYYIVILLIAISRYLHDYCSLFPGVYGVAYIWEF